MPRVEPFYAVKCNPEPNIIAALAALGAGFDCASVAVLQAAAAAGVPQERILFANPCKRPGDFRLVLVVLLCLCYCNTHPPTLSL